MTSRARGCATSAAAFAAVLATTTAARGWVMQDDPGVFLDTIEAFLAGAGAARATGDEG